MKLTKADREFLKRNYWDNDDQIDQIERAIAYTDYEIQLNSNGWEPVTRDKVIELIGREEWLSGMERSAFHRSACRENKDKTVLVFFDSGRFFKGV